jgi:hypothetical protein
MLSKNVASSDTTQSMFSSCLVLTVGASYNAGTSTVPTLLLPVPSDSPLPSSVAATVKSSSFLPVSPDYTLHDHF